jgi:hypothetical protein
MKRKDEIRKAREQGAKWALIAAQANGLARDAVLTKDAAGEDVLDALGHRLGHLLTRLAETVADLIVERGEEFARAFEEAAREEIARHIPSFTQYLH